uniref:Uncharacterized protein n=1 Tax=Triticum urartu TaxID=4572 RepID=A0A8R7TZT7_TRIUA
MGSAQRWLLSVPERLPPPGEANAGGHETPTGSRFWSSLKNSQVGTVCPRGVCIPPCRAEGDFLFSAPRITRIWRTALPTRRHSQNPYFAITRYIHPPRCRDTRIQTHVYSVECYTF